MCSYRRWVEYNPGHPTVTVTHSEYKILQMLGYVTIIVILLNNHQTNLFSCVERSPSTGLPNATVPEVTESQTCAEGYRLQLHKWVPNVNWYKWRRPSDLFMYLMHFGGGGFSNFYQNFCHKYQCLVLCCVSETAGQRETLWQIWALVQLILGVFSKWLHSEGHGCLLFTWPDNYRRNTFHLYYILLSFFLRNVQFCL